MNTKERVYAAVINTIKNKCLYVSELNESIKQDYIAYYPEDNLGESISEEVTYCGLFYTLLIGKTDVYTFLGVNDSITRENVFTRLSSLLNIDYNFIYCLWLNSKY